jgi:hypothetical protein
LRSALFVSAFLKIGTYKRYFDEGLPLAGFAGMGIISNNIWRRGNEDEIHDSRRIAWTTINGDY